jgi:uracil-DNA glycosylase family 4
MQSNNINLKVNNLLKYYLGVLSQLGDFQQFGNFPIIIADEPHVPLKTEIKIVEKATVPIVTKEPQAKAIPKIVQTAQVTKQEYNLDNIQTLQELRLLLTKTEICEIQHFSTNTVFGDGNPNAKILVIGEAPGQEEDEQGIPFCGRSGQLLMNAFSSIGLQRNKNFFITNNIFWRPPGNRKPTDAELASCKPFLKKMIEIINPEVVICIGAVAAQNILETQNTISSLRGRVFNKAFDFTTKVFCLYHPSYLLRNPSKKYEMYKDLLGILPNISHLL